MELLLSPGCRCYPQKLRMKTNPSHAHHQWSAGSANIGSDLIRNFWNGVRSPELDKAAQLRWLSHIDLIAGSPLSTLPLELPPGSVSHLASNDRTRKLHQVSVPKILAPWNAVDLNGTNTRFSGGQTRCGCRDHSPQCLNDFKCPPTTAPKTSKMNTSSQPGFPGWGVIPLHTMQYKTPPETMVEYWMAACIWSHLRGVVFFVGWHYRTIYGGFKMYCRSIYGYYLW